MWLGRLRLIAHKTYQSEFEIVSELNETVAGSEIQQVGKGDHIPGIPQHQLKLRAAYDVTPSWNVGTNIFAFSDQYARGNENNQYDGDGAKISGYLVMNLDTRYRFANSGWQFFAKVNNVFDREYNNGGLLGEHRFDASTGAFTGNEVTPAFYAPGAPRAGWFGFRYEFGGKKTVAAVDND